MEFDRQTASRERPQRRRAKRGDTVDWSHPFARLALVHLLGVMGETLVVLSLASSFFFNIDPARGREKVIMGLLFTMAPFAVVGPFIGPFVDRVRGGHRAVIRGAMFIRAGVAALMVAAVVGDSPALFVEAFVMLVLAKTYQIVRAAVVPTTVAGELELVEANSKLQLLSSVASSVSGVIGGVCLLLGEPFLLTVTAIVFAAAGVAALRLQPSAAGAVEETEHERRPDREVVVSKRLGASAFSMGLIRFLVGFVTFLMAFELRGGGTVTLADRAANATLESARAFNPKVTVPPLGDGPPTWYFGAVLVASVVGGLLGAMVAPRLRARLAEDLIQQLGCGLAVGAAIVSAFLPGLGGYVLLSFGTAFSAALAKQAFDAAVQAEVQELDRGQVFARYESRFQVAWVAGALVPTALRIPAATGGWLAAIVAAAATLALRYEVRPIVRRPRGTAPTAGTDATGGAGVAATAADQASKSGKSGMSMGSSSSGSD